MCTLPTTKPAITEKDESERTNERPSKRTKNGVFVYSNTTTAASTTTTTTAAAAATAAPAAATALPANKIEKS